MGGGRSGRGIPALPLLVLLAGLGGACRGRGEPAPEVRTVPGVGDEGASTTPVPPPALGEEDLFRELEEEYRRRHGATWPPAGQGPVADTTVVEQPADGEGAGSEADGGLGELLAAAAEGDGSGAVGESGEEPGPEETVGAPAGEGPGEEDPRDEEEDLGPPQVNPFLQFGIDIIPYDPDGDGVIDVIMKPIPLPVGMGQRVIDLYKVYGEAEVFAELKRGQPVPADLPPKGELLLDLHDGAMIEAWADPRALGIGAAPSPVSLGDILYVTGDPDSLMDFEEFLDVFFAEGVRQVEIEAKIVEVNTTDELDLGVRPGTDGAPIFGLPGETFVSGIDFAFGNTVAAGEALFHIRSVHDGLTIDAILEAVARFENVEIISRPKVAVREGGRAEIVNITQIPFYNVGGLNPGGGYGAVLDKKDVGVKLYVVPRIIGSRVIDLTIDVEASQQSGTSVSFLSPSGQLLSNPVLTNRSARTSVYLEPGQAIVLGGLISDRVVKTERKVPILGDFPVIGHLFKSQLRRKERTDVLFFIRPRILQGSDLRRSLE